MKCFGFELSGSASPSSRPSCGGGVFGGLSRRRLSAFAIAAVAAVLVLVLVLFPANGRSSPPPIEIRANARSPIADRPPPGDGAGGFHSGTRLGGVRNLGHPAAARSFLGLDGDVGRRLKKDGKDDNEGGEYEFEDVFVPVSNVGHAVHSLSPENVLNFMGHYVHDEHRSPYASHLYARNVTKLKMEQRAFERKMAKVRKKWGAWDFKDDYGKRHGGKDRPLADFSEAPYRDLNGDKFPDGSWQTDPAYVDKFLSEAAALVTRVKEGIYAEYGQPTIKSDGTKLTSKEIADRDRRFAVAHDEGEDRAGKVGWLDPNAWDGLVTKLLHSMITNDEFYVVTGGHSAAAGHGNNFRQSKTMAFHHLMEPVFDRLGMRLISRNMAQGGVGTTHSSFAGAGIYGEKDVLFWDSGMTEKGAGAHDLFNKQAILGGERVPVLMNSPPVNIMEETDGKAWIGRSLEYQRVVGGMISRKTLNETQAMDVPFAMRYMFCPREMQRLCDRHKFDAVCWEPRSDVTPSKPQSPHPGSQARRHPGAKAHLQAARVMSLVMLHALEAAIGKWRGYLPKGGSEKKKNKSALPPDDQWHVGERYRSIQDTLRTHISISKKTSKKSECEKLFSRFPRVCRVAMRGFTEWTPSRVPDEASLTGILKPAPDGYLPHLAETSEYAGIDVLPYGQRVPTGEVDVHAIAIATTASPPPPKGLDHDVADEDERRRLAEASRSAMRLVTRRAWEMHRRERRRLEKGDEGPTRSAAPKSNNEAIVPGRGWVLDKRPQHSCDGSYTSECGRRSGGDCLLSGHNDGRGGLLGDGLSGWLVFTVPRVKEGLILLRIEWWVGGGGNWRTKGWTEVNDGRTDVSKPKYVFPMVKPWANSTDKTRRRMLPVAGDIVQRASLSDDDSDDLSSGGDGSGAEVHDRRRRRQLGSDLPDDTQFDIAINGEIVRTMDKVEFMSWGKDIVKNFALWPVLDDARWAKRDWGVEGADGEDVEAAVRIRCREGKKCAIKISHLYYA